MADATAPLSGRTIRDSERVATGIGGALLLGYGLARRPSIASVLLAAAGALLVARAVRGRSALFRALGTGVSGQPHRRHAWWQDDPDAMLLDEVERASDASFPASDPPSWSASVAGCPAR